MFDKLDAYNLVANLIPGAALVYALNYSDFPTPNLEEIGAFLLVSFVAGVTANRTGSLVVDPLLRGERPVFFWYKWSFLRDKDYTSFVESGRDDQKLDTLVANSGLYRTFFTCGIVYLVLLALGHALEKVPNEARVDWLFVTFVVTGMVIFLFALKKEDDYIAKRLNVTKCTQSGCPRQSKQKA